MILLTTKHLRYESCHTCAWVTSHAWTKHDTKVILNMIQLCIMFDISIYNIYVCIRYITYVCIRMYVCTRYSSHAKPPPTLWVISHVCLSQVTRVNETCRKTFVWNMQFTQKITMHVVSHVTHVHDHTYECVISNVFICHVTRIKTSCHTCAWDMANVWRRHVSRMKESWHTYEGVMPRVWRSHVTRMKGVMSHISSVMAYLWRHRSCHTYEWVMSHI